MSKTIYVYENWKSDQPNKIGELYVDFIKGKEVFSFAYEDDWLENTFDACLLDPDLMLYNGRQYAPVGKEMFGVFSDSSPDRWGRLLMDRRESILAKEEDRKPRKLTQSDYLLGVYDQARMGALRFKTEEDGEFLSNDKTMAAPPWTSLRLGLSSEVVLLVGALGVNEVITQKPNRCWDAESQAGLSAEAGPFRIFQMLLDK